MWFDVLTAVDSQRFGDLTPVEVLYEFDGPRIFIARDRFGGDILCYACGESTVDQTITYLIVPTDARAIAALKEGITTVHDALDQPWLWVAHLSYDG